MTAENKEPNKESEHKPKEISLMWTDICTKRAKEFIRNVQGKNSFVAGGALVLEFGSGGEDADIESSIWQRNDYSTG